MLLIPRSLGRVRRQNKTVSDCHCPAVLPTLMRSDNDAQSPRHKALLEQLILRLAEMFLSTHTCSSLSGQWIKNDWLETN